MKKRTVNKVKKFIPKIGMWLLWSGIGVLCAYVSVDSFVSLHDGASFQEVSGRKYAPVLNELLLMIGVVVALLFLLKITVKLKMIHLIAIGILLFGLIGWFGYWAFSYTRQDPTEGFSTLLIIIVSVSLITATALLYESHARRRNNRINGSKKK